MEMELTIITPTYNRAYLLENLYKSLTKQKNKNFKWLIVDDGSKDGTKKLIEKLTKQNKIEIEYIYQENGGKHRAINNAIRHVNTKLVMIVDSDDQLKEDAIEIVENYYNKYKDIKEIGSISFLKEYSNGQIIGKKYYKDEFISDYVNCRLNKNIYGDKQEIFWTEALKKYPFIEIEGENFLFEDYSWIQIASQFKTVYINKSIYVAEYLNDGLTKNINRKKMKSPRGMMERAKVTVNAKTNIRVKTKAMLQYIAYGHIAKVNNKTLYNDIQYKILFIVLFPFSIIIEFYWNIKKGKNI